MRDTLTNVECVQCRSIFATKFRRQKRCDECKEDNRSVRSENYLSKRERFAAMAMQGMLPQLDTRGHEAYIAKGAVQLADALIAELAKTEGR